MNSRCVAHLAMTVTAAAALLVGAAACSSQNAPSVPSPPSIPGAGALAAGLKDHLGVLASGSGALTALGQLGQQKAVSEQVKSLAGKLVSDNQGLTDKLQQAGSAVGITLPDPNTPQLQKTLNELKQKSGGEFDKAWLDSVQTAEQDAQSAADGLASAQGVPAQVSQVAQDARDQLQADQEQAKQAAEAVGATPGGPAQSGTTATSGGEAPGAAGAPGASGAPGAAGSATTGTAAAPQAGKRYTVQRGDTLSSIARRAYGDSHDEKKIAEANHLPDHDVIAPGQVLTLP